MTDARHSHGMILRHRVSDAGAYATVAEIMNQNVPAPSRQKIVTTPHSSKAQTSISGKVVEYSNLTLSINHLPSTEESQRNIEGGMDPNDGDGRIDGWQIETPDGETWTFKGWVMRYEVDTPEDGHITAAVEIVVTGLITHDYRGVVTLSSYAPTDTDTLTATLSDPDGSSALNYQWQRKVGRGAWADIGSATNKTYEVVAADDTEADWKAKLRCKVTYTDGAGAGSVTAYSPETAPAVA